MRFFVQAGFDSRACYFRSPHHLILSGEILTTPVVGSRVKPVKGAFYAISGRFVSQFFQCDWATGSYRYPRRLTRLCVFIGKISGGNTILPINRFFSVYAEFIGLGADDIELGKMAKHIAVPLAL